MTSADDLFGSLEGSEIPGGCDQCNAVQRTTEVAPRIWSVIVAHDDDCPSQRTKKANLN
jgi:hypothetical protein